MFVLVGAAIIWRLQAQEDLEPVRRLCMYTFGVLVIISGALSIYLDKTWFTGVDPYTKIPMYGLLGVSVAFALTFAIVDLINYVS